MKLKQKVSFPYGKKVKWKTILIVLYDMIILIIYHINGTISAGAISR